MCGICGVMGIHGAGVDTPTTVRAMSNLIAHRGPDGEGFWDTPNGTIGHRRLAIIDVAGGRQPMFNEDESIGIVFNGEIYNFAALRDELLARGHRFQSRSDTEVLIHGYEEWGDDVLRRLRGMFAFAIWDTRKHRLFVARDRLGIKPFYYWYDEREGRLVFGSEIKALFAADAVPRAVNRDRLGEYLLFRYVSGSDTMFEGVRKLEPGTYGVLDAAGLRLTRYWQPELPVEPADGSAAVEEGRALMADAVRSHLVSDVGVGTVTSGGLDSSLVSALAAQDLGGGLNTFCLGFEDPSLDERPYARQVAEAIGSRHHDAVLGAADFSDQLDLLTWMHDEPISHPNAIAMHRVFVLARRDAGIPVLLSGEGADEVFGGYGWYRASHKLDRIRGVLGRRMTSAALGLMLRGQARDLADPDYLMLSNALGRAPELIAVPAVREAIVRRRDAYGRLCDSTSGLFLYDQMTYLQPLLQRQDRMSMAVGLEARVPFLDHPLVEWGNSLDVRTKLDGGQPKQLLRTIAEGTLSREIIYREKVGFALPLGDWLRGGLRERLRMLDSDSSLAASIVDRPLIRKAILTLDSGRDDSSTLLWTLLALEIWQDQFLSGNVAERPLAGTLGTSTGSPMDAR